MSNPASNSLICIVCPRGCHLTVDDQLQVTGNACPRGEVYGVAEMTHPSRVVTSTVRLMGGNVARLPVKTSCPVPKEKMKDVMAEIHHLQVTAPVTIGDVLVPHILGLDADLVATRTVD